MVVSYGSSATVTFEEAVKGYIEDFNRTIALDGVVFINQYGYYREFDYSSDYIKTNGGMLVFSAPVTEDVAIHGSTSNHYVVEGLDYVSGMYMAKSKGIAAKEYADEVYMRMFLKLENGSYVYGDIIEYSVQDYCEHKLYTPGYKQALIDVCATLLHYGAAAQVQLSNYNGNDLANAAILEDYPVYEYDEAYIQVATEANTSIIADSEVSYVGNTIALDGAIVSNFYYSTTVSNVAKAELIMWEGVSGTLTETNYTSVVDMTLTGGRYIGVTREFAAKEYDTVIYGCARITDTNGNVYYGSVVGHSPETYAYKQITTSTNANLVEVCKRMVTYGHYSKIQFGLTEPEA